MHFVYHCFRFKVKAALNLSWALLIIWHLKWTVLKPMSHTPPGFHIIDFQSEQFDVRVCVCVRAALMPTISTHSIRGKRTDWLPQRETTQAGVLAVVSSRARTASTPMRLACAIRRHTDTHTGHSPSDDSLFSRESNALCAFSPLNFTISWGNFPLRLGSKPTLLVPDKKLRTLRPLTRAVTCCEA